MNWELPNWYMTTQEFADLVVDTLEDSGYFKKTDLCHPEDIVVAFTSVAEAIAKGAGFVGRKVHKNENRTK